MTDTALVTLRPERVLPSNVAIIAVLLLGLLGLLLVPMSFDFLRLGWARFAVAALISVALVVEVGIVITAVWRGFALVTVSESGRLHMPKRIGFRTYWWPPTRKRKAASVDWGSAHIEVNQRRELWGRMVHVTVTDGSGVRLETFVPPSWIEDDIEESWDEVLRQHRKLSSSE